MPSLALNLEYSDPVEQGNSVASFTFRFFYSTKLLTEPRNGNGEVETCEQEKFYDQETEKVGVVEPSSPGCTSCGKLGHGSI